MTDQNDNSAPDVIGETPIASMPGPAPATPSQIPSYDLDLPPDHHAQPTPSPTAPEEQPIAAPRGYTAAEQKQFASLPREAQEAIARRESDRERHFHEVRGKLAQDQRTLEAAAAEIRQAQVRFQELLPNLATGLERDFLRDYGDIKSEADVTKLQEEDPVRFARFSLELTKLRDIQAQAHARAVAEHNARQAQFEAFGQQQDRIFQERNPNVTQAEWAGVRRYLSEGLGLSEQQAMHLWFTSPDFRSAGGQQLLLDASRYYEGQRRVRQARPVAPPKPLRPGTHNTFGPATDTLALAAAKGDMDSFIRQRNRNGKAR